MSPRQPDTSPDDPVVITGMGLTSPWGTDRAATILTAPPHRNPIPDNRGVWRVPDQTLAPDAKRIAELGGDRAALLALPAIRHALDQAGLPLAEADPRRVGLVLGSAFAALPDMLRFAGEVKHQSPRFVSPLYFPQTVGNYAAGAIARTLKINGPNLTLGGGPQAGLAAIDQAAQLLQARWADLILAGGADSVSQNLLPAMIDADHVQPTGPFASQPAEAACFFAIELQSRARKRSATVLARLITATHPACPLLVSGDFSGRLSRDRTEADALLEQTGLHGPDICFLSSRHLLANAFAATAAAQLALAVAALNRHLVPLWRPDRTDRADRLELPGTPPPRVGAALAASGPDHAALRTLIHASAP